LLKLSVIKKYFHSYLNDLEEISQQEKAFIIDKLFGIDGALMKLLVHANGNGRAFILTGSWSNAFIFFAESFREVVVCETDRKRQNISKHLAGLLKIDVKFSEDIFKSLLDTKNIYDLILLDNSIDKLLTFGDWAVEPTSDKKHKKILCFLKKRCQCIIIAQDINHSGSEKNLENVTFRPTLFSNRLNQLSKYLLKLRKIGTILFRYFNHPVRSIQKAAKKAGYFYQIKTYIYPNRNTPRQIIGLENSFSRKQKRTIKNVFMNYTVKKYFSESYVFLAQTKSDYQGVLKQILTKVNESNPTNDAFFIESIHFQETKCALLLLNSLEGDRAVMRLPFDNASFSRLQNGMENIIKLKRNNIEAKTRVIPNQISYGTLFGQPYFVEKRLSGIAATCLIKNQKALYKLMEETIDYIDVLSSSYLIFKTVDRNIFERYFAATLLKASSSITDLSRAIEHIIFYLQDKLIGEEIPLLMVHGDLNLSNILIDRQTHTLTGIVDWDMSRMHGPPLLDVIHLIVGKYGRLKKWEIGESITRVLFPNKFNNYESRIISNYISKTRIKKDFYKALIIVYWSEHCLRNLVESGGLKDSTWIENNITNVLRYMEEEIL